MLTLTLQDESMAGQILRTIEIQVENEQMTVRELISARVREEVDRYNAKAGDIYQGLIQPGDAEATLNGYAYKMRSKRFVDPEKQVYVALDAFKKNNFFVLVDNMQVTNLEESILVDARTKVSFIRLMPLVGG